MHRRIIESVERANGAGAHSPRAWYEAGVVVMRRSRVPLLMLGVLGAFALLVHLPTYLYDDGRQWSRSGMDKVWGGALAHNTGCTVISLTGQVRHVVVKEQPQK